MVVPTGTVERTGLQRPLVDPTVSERKPHNDVGLESVLTESSLPYLRRVYLGSCIEMKLLFRLALPAILVYLVNSGMSISARIFAGHLGSQELAAASLGNSCFFLVYGLMVRFYSTLHGEWYNYLKLSTLILLTHDSKLSTLFKIINSYSVDSWYQLLNSRYTT